MSTKTTTYEVKPLLELVYASTSKWASLLTILTKYTQIEVISIDNN